MFFKVWFEFAKPHICESKEISDMVCADVQSRGGGTPRVEAAEKLLIDFGGCIASGSKPISVPLLPHVRFWAHQYSLLRSEISTAQKRQGDYYKLHGWQIAVCLSEDSFATLSEFLIANEETLLHQEAIALEDLQLRLASIRSM